MAGIEALKIDVQGFEDQVLEGYGPLLSGIRLLMVELSMVECYEGAPDLFSLDRRIVDEYGFRRISLEPTYYDDVTGVVQQYDGIYFRPDLPPPRSASRSPSRAVSTGDFRTIFLETEPGRALVLGTDETPSALSDRGPDDWVLGLHTPGGMVMRVPSELANDVRDQPDLLEGFSLDEPDWDLALALIAVISARSVLSGVCLEASSICLRIDGPAVRRVPETSPTNGIRALCRALFGDRRLAQGYRGATDLRREACGQPCLRKLQYRVQGVHGP
jgi:hypothetical protein